MGDGVTGSLGGVEAAAAFVFVAPGFVAGAFAAAAFAATGFVAGAFAAGAFAVGAAFVAGVAFTAGSFGAAATPSLIKADLRSLIICFICIVFFISLALVHDTLVDVAHACSCCAYSHIDCTLIAPMCMWDVLVQLQYHICVVVFEYEHINIYVCR